MRLPYPGLRPFQRAESDLFFGREDCVDDMVDRLAATRFLAVLGTSGSGKSSLVLTGLLDALEIGLHARAGSRWRIAHMRPGPQPTESLARELLSSADTAQPIAKRDVEMLSSYLSRGPRSLAEWCLDGNLAAGTNLLILVDQFEELFRYGDYAGREEAEAFVALLLESARASDAEIHVTITMRSEYLGDCALIPGLAERINAGLYLAPRMSREEVRAAIEGPAAVCGFAIEPGLVNRLLNDLASLAPWEDDRSSDQFQRLSRRADQLPLMQHVLNRMWLRAAEATGGEPIRLRLADYDRAGGLVGALDAHGREVFEGLEAADRPAAEIVFRALVSGTSLANAVRRPCRFDALVAMTEGNRAAVTRVVDAFRAPDCNFLTPPPPAPLDDATIIDISHESLIRQWSLLRDWVRTEFQSSETYRHIETSAQLWTKGEARLAMMPYLGVALTWRRSQHPNAAWAARYGGDFTLAMRFLDASGRSRRRRRFLGYAAAVLIVVGSSGFGVFELHLATVRKAALAAAHANLVETQNAQNQIQQYLASADRELKKNNTPGALKFAKMARARIKKLTAAAPSNVGYQQTLTICDDKIGDVLRAQDQLGDALIFYHEELAIFQNLAHAQPTDALWQDGLMIDDDKIGDVLDKQNHLDAALAAYRGEVAIERAIVEKHPDDTVGQLDLALGDDKIGIVLKAQNHLDAALAAYRDSLAIRKALVREDPDNTDWQIKLSISEDHVGSVLQELNRLDAALAAYRDELAIDTTLARQDPKNTQRQHDLSFDDRRIGGVLQVQNHLDAALTVYRDERAILQALVLENPGDMLWEDDLMASDDKIGDVLRAQHHLDAAIPAYRDSLRIHKGLTLLNPTNTDWQRDLLISDDKIGDVLKAQNHLNSALAAYRDGLAVKKVLALKEPGNSEWQQDLSVGDDNIGGVLKAQNHLNGALAAYRDGLAIKKALALKEPGNTEWQQDLSVSDDNIGGVLKAQNHLNGALAAYRDGLAIKKALALKDPGNTDWQRDLLIADDKIGDVLKAQNHLNGALAAYRDGLAIKKALVLKEPGHTEWKHDLSFGDDKIGDVLQAQGHLNQALAAYRDEIAIDKALALENPGNTKWQHDVAYDDGKIGSVLLAQGHLDQALAAYRDELAADLAVVTIR